MSDTDMDCGPTQSENACRVCGGQRGRDCPPDGRLDGLYDLLDRVEDRVGFIPNLLLIYAFVIGWSLLLTWMVAR